MFWEYIDWATTKEEIIIFLLLGLFCMAFMEMTLGNKEGRKERFRGWGICILLTVLLSTLYYSVMSGVLTCVDIYLWGDSMVLTEEQVLSVSEGVRLLYSLSNFISIFLIRFIPLLIIMAGVIKIYKQSRSVKVFTIVLAALCCTILIYYVHPLLTLPLRTESNEFFCYMKYDWMNILTQIIILAAALLIFQRKLCNPLKTVLNVPDGRMDSFVKIPLISFFAFQFLFNMLMSNGFFIDSIYIENILLCVVIYGSLILAFVMLYWSIFRGISLASTAMRNQAELDVAKNIQSSVLPCSFPAFPDRENFHIHATMNTAKEVGGDFYDFFLIDETHLAVVIADVSGKGIPAALFMMTARTLIKNLALSGLSPENVLHEANNRLCENNDSNMFVTAFLGIWDMEKKTLCFANAGHNLPLISTDRKPFTWLPAKHGFILGGMENIRFQRQEISFGPSDRLFLYTDGVTEALNPNQELYSDQRLLTLFQSDTLNGKTPSQVLQTVKESVDAFSAGAEQADDITMLFLEIS